MDLKFVIKSIKYFYSYLGWRLFLLTFFSLVVGILDGLGMTMFFPLLQMVNQSDGQSIVPHGEGFIPKLLIFLGINIELIPLLFAMIVFFFIKRIGDVFK